MDIIAGDGRQRDWGIDLVETLNQGKIRDVMTDASSVRPEGSRSIIDIADEAMYNALDLTYANAPAGIAAAGHWRRKGGAVDG